uniref:Uncharacterized protein n=1 Tax=Glossina austeni TaxID=7395 RepID=A0A1A9VLU1_GLOAU
MIGTQKLVFVSSLKVCHSVLYLALAFLSSVDFLSDKVLPTSCHQTVGAANTPKIIGITKDLIVLRIVWLTGCNIGPFKKSNEGVPLLGLYYNEKRINNNKWIHVVMSDA